MSTVLKDNDVANAIKGMDGWEYDDVTTDACAKNLLSIALNLPQLSFNMSPS